MTFDEPDFEQHVRNVVQDVRDGITDPDDAVTAILEHPGRSGIEPLSW